MILIIVINSKLLAGVKGSESCAAVGDFPCVMSRKVVTSLCSYEESAKRRASLENRLCFRATPRFLA